MAQERYKETLANLFGRHAMGMRLGLAGVRALLDALGQPDDHFPYVLVAGTNGKGSTSRLLAGTLEAAGHRVGLYTSPHVLTYGERIQVQGVPLTEAEVVAYAADIRQAEAALEEPATFFEATTAMACLAFRDRKVDLAVVEVGLGGRLDATNALPDAERLLTVLTPIDLDHTHILGRDRVTIAHEKAGILRPNVPAVSAPQWPDVAEALTARAQALGTTLTWARTPVPGEGLLPGYLAQNALVADCARQALPAYGATRAHLTKTAETFHWPGRYNRLPPRRPGGPSYLVDGSHNPSGIRALLAALDGDPALGAMPRHAVFAAMPTKDVEAMRADLAPNVASLTECALEVRGPSAKHRTPAPARPTLKAALDRLDASLGAGDLVLVVGSLFLAGEALHVLLGLPRDPPIAG